MSLKKMLNAPQILNNVSASVFLGLGTNVRDFLKITLNGSLTLGHNEVKLYQNFIIKFLHTVVTKIKEVKEECSLQEILQATTCCCEALVNMQHILELDKAFTVPKLVYHVIYRLQKQEYAEDLINMSELLYKMFSVDNYSVLTEVHPVINANVAVLWTMAGKLVRQQTGEATVASDVVIRLWKVSFHFLCLLPDTSSMIDRLRSTIIDFLPTATFGEENHLNPNCVELIFSIFESLVEKMTASLQYKQEPDKKDMLSCYIIQVKVLYIEHLLKSSEISKAREIVSGIKGDNDTTNIVANVFRVSIGILEETEDMQTAELPNMLKEANQSALKALEGCDQENLKLLYWTYSYFAKLAKLESLCSEFKIQFFTEQCLVALDLSLAISVKMMEALAGEKESKDKKKSDQCTKVFVGMLKHYYRELQLICHVLRASEECTPDEELLKKCVSVASDFGSWLEKDPYSLPSKALYAHRYNCGLICSSVAKICFRQGQYSYAADFYQTAVHRLHQCQEPKMIKLMECLVESYLQLDKLTEATKVIIEALMIAGDDITPCVALWYKLKKEALAKKQVMFQSMTLAAVVQEANATIPGVTDRQLLQAECQSWRKATRRNLEVEYHILCELYEATAGEQQKAEVMIDLAANMCHTGYQYKNSPAGELLNKAIITLDKHADKPGATLALAYYTKYIITHEQVIQEQSGVNPEIEPQDTTVEINTDRHSEDKPNKTHYTLQSEQPYLPYLTRAVQLWDDWFSNKSSAKVKKKKSAGSQINVDIDLERHVGALMECGTRLILMKQPLLAMRALKTAHSQLDEIPSGRQKENLQLQMARMWLLLGRYREAEGLILSGDMAAVRESQPVLQAELCMLNGKKEEGVDILNKILDDESSQQMTMQSILTDGTAKRLLSMLLCFPDSYAINNTHQYLLSLAFEAVRSHISVLRSIVKNDSAERVRIVSTDKCFLLYEMLQSLLHLCQLCRFVGLPNDALPYLKEGLEISQNSGLPRWSCEFLFELIRVHSLVGNYMRAMETIDIINTVLNTEMNNSHSEDEIDPCSRRNKSVNACVGKKAESNSLSVPSDSDCFGFENMPVEQKKNVTPEKEFISQKLNSVHKKKISKLTVPVCGCMKDKSKCVDNVRHRLCMKAGIVLAEFVSQADMASTAEKLLSDSKSSVCVKNGDSVRNSLADIILQHVSETSDNGHLFDPQMVYLCLEASCIEAEMNMYQNNYQQVHQIWRTMSEIQQAGYLKNVLHSNVVMTRLALCEVNAYMKSLQRCTVTSDLVSSQVDSIGRDLQSLNLNDKRVSFCEEGLAIKGKKMKGARRNLLGSSEEIKVDNDSAGTPKKISVFTDDCETTSSDLLTQLNSKSAKKDRLVHMLKTPVSNKKAILDFLIDSDSDEESDVLFPKLKPVTPKVTAKKGSKSQRARTEPRKYVRKGKADMLTEPNPVYKLEEILEATGTECEIGNVETENKENLEIENIPVLETSKTIDDEVNDKDKLCNLEIEGQQMNLVEKAVGRGRGRKTYSRKAGIAKGRGSRKLEVQVSNADVSNESLEKSTKSTKKDSIKHGRTLKSNLSSNIPNHVVNDDVYDFNVSPVVSKVVKSKAKGTKPGGNAAKTKSCKSSGKTEKGKENETTVEKKPLRTRRGRAKKDADETECQRNLEEQTSNQLEISFDEIHNIEETDTAHEDIEFDIDLREAVSIDYRESSLVDVLSESQEHHAVEIPEEQDFEPIEVMRSDVEPAPVKKSTRTSKKSVKKQAATKKRDSTDVTDCSASLEVMRSGCPLSLEALSEKMNSPGVVADVAEVSGVGAGGDMSVSQSSVIASLEMMYEQIRHLAWYPQHPDICQVLAMQYIDTDPSRAAFLLSDSIAVTFRHQAMLNVGRKVRKNNEKRDRSLGGALQGAGDNLTCIKDGLLFDKNETSLKEMITIIPTDWVVVQLSVVSAVSTGQQFVLTRFVNDQNPLVVRLPGFSTPQGRQILKDFSHIIECNRDSVKIQSRSEWWGTREKLNLDLQTLVENMEKFWLGQWVAAFMHRQFSEKLVTKVAKEVKKTVKRDIDIAQIEILLLSASRLSEHQLSQCASDLLSSSCSQADIQATVTVIKKYAKPDKLEEGNHHVVLILDKTIQHLPWESIPALNDLSVSRVPCLPHLYTVLNYLQTQESSVFNTGVNPRHTYYIINPDLDLPHLEKTFKEWFEGQAEQIRQLLQEPSDLDLLCVHRREPGWKGICGTKPTREQFTEALTERDLLIYCGHGSGARYFGHDEIEKLQGRAVTMLMGCSSGKLSAKGRLEPSGIMLSYFMAGCPCMVANLWDVTDKDIDKFTYDVLHTWLNAEDGASLSRQVQKSRQVCKMKYLVGSAPVVYGLPVFLSRKSQ